MRLLRARGQVPAGGLHRRRRLLVVLRIFGTALRQDGSGGGGHSRHHHPGNSLPLFSSDVSVVSHRFTDRGSLDRISLDRIT